MNLTNKVVLITDVDQASGRLLAELMAEGGAYVYGNARQPHPELEEAAEQIGRKGGIFHINYANLANSAEVDALRQRCLSMYDRIDLLIHNNKAVEPVNVRDCTEAQYAQMMDDNAKTAFICTQSFGAQMIKQQSGRVVYVSSIHAEKPTGRSFVYSVAKGAVQMLASEMALELGRHGIAVNVIELGPMLGDDVLFGCELSRLYQKYEQKVPRKKLIEIDELAHLVTFLADDRVHYLNGANLRLDGGFLLHYADHKLAP